MPWGAAGLLLAEIYLALGLVVAIGFVSLGLTRAFPHSGPLTLGARLLILPASALLWPLVLRRWASPR